MTIKLKSLLKEGLGDKEHLRLKKGYYKEATADQGEIALYDGPEGEMQIVKRGRGYYGWNNKFDFEAKNKKELVDKLKRWKYKLSVGKI